jgi:hypothetical protein
MYDLFKETAMQHIKQHLSYLEESFPSITELTDIVTEVYGRTLVQRRIPIATGASSLFPAGELQRLISWGKGDEDKNQTNRTIKAVVLTMLVVVNLSLLHFQFSSVQGDLLRN